MKRLSNLLAALVFASLVIFMSCGGSGGDDGPSDLEIAVDNLTISGGFSVSDQSQDVKTDNGTADGDWANFTITYSGSVDGGTYDVEGVPAGFEDVWADGTWTINDAATVITKTHQGGTATEMVASIGEGTLTLEFDVADPTARISGIAGSWTFILN